MESNERTEMMQQLNNDLQRGVSVILCTYNGADKLPETIRHLAEQKMPLDVSWEVVFVDNNSSDGSLEVACREWGLYGPVNVDFIALHETRPAKYYALQTAMAHVRFSYFVICDDDNWLASDYLSRALSLLERHPEVGAVGGQGIPVFPENWRSPSWFSSYSEGYAVGQQADKTGYVTKRGYLWGAGLGSRTAVYKSFYEKYPSFLLLHDDPSIMTTEDTEYCLRLILRGYDLYYDSALKFKHFIPEDKLTEDYMHALYKKNHEGFVVTGNYYLAVKLFDKCGRLKPLNKLRLKLLTPLRLWLARTHKKRIREQTIMSYLFLSARYKNHITPHVLDFLKDETVARYGRLVSQPSSNGN
ncbi:glycosyltransferase family 2 protein [Parapedobacter deserti]|uniref:Glycosyltransferase family 2 protein n=1 Tax=Parapedobacter deserti TaxID=1912957 RepID=A0ABV7JR50_9SPHI